jgi:hypothetical protein
MHINLWMVSCAAYLFQFTLDSLLQLFKPCFESLNSFSRLRLKHSNFNNCLNNVTKKNSFDKKGLRAFFSLVKMDSFLKCISSHVTIFWTQFVSKKRNLFVKFFFAYQFSEPANLSATPKRIFFTFCMNRFLSWSRSFGGRKEAPLSGGSVR